MPRSVAAITTVYNEERTIGRLLDSLLVQTRPPDEIVVVDAGSTDRTQAIIADYLEKGVPAKLIVEAGASRSRGRNLAIAQSSGEIIASIDAGCTAARHWLEELIAPFEESTPPDVVSGYYEPDAHTVLEEAIAVATVPPSSAVKAGSFLPSSRSVAFTRAAWQRVGGYPEHVEFAEDTLFDLALKRAGCRFRFRPEARVRWRIAPTFGAAFRQFYRYARADGTLGHWFLHYQKASVFFLTLVALLVVIEASPWPLLSTVAKVGFGLATALYLVRYVLRARRRGADWDAALLSVLVILTVDTAHLLGYTVGRLRRRPVHPPLPEDRPLSIAQITYTYQPVSGGADVYASQLVDLIAAAGHHQVVYQRRAETDAPEVRFIPNPLRGRPFEFWTQTLGLFRLWRELMSYDVVICHYPPYLLAIWLMSLLTRGPVRVGISHGVFWDDRPRSLGGRLKAWFATLAFRRAHLYVANDTNFLRAMGVRIPPQHRMHAPIGPGVWFIPNGVDTNLFRPTAALPEVRTLNPILVPRNLFRNRGIHLAVEAFGLFHQDHPDTHLLIVGGGGQPDYVEQLRQDIARRGLADAVVFYGPAPHALLPAIYSGSRLTLIPSLCGEGTSLSALESMACGTATICTAVAGLLDLPGPHADPAPAPLVEVMRQVYLKRLATGDEQRQIVLERYSLSTWRHSWRAALASIGVSVEVRRQEQLPM